MNAIKQATWICILLIMLASSGWYFARSKPSLTLDAQTLSKTYDTIIYDLRVRQFDTQGQLTHWLQTPQLTHIPENNIHELKTPYIKVTQKNEASWEIHAQEAIAVQGGKQVTFRKKVIISKQNDNHSPETTLKTEEITYFPKDQLATTLKDVTFVQSGNQVQSTGMKAYLAENRIQLLSNARGIYDSSHG